jgi:hypothetical protein
MQRLEDPMTKSAPFVFGLVILSAATACAQPRGPRGRFERAADRADVNRSNAQLMDDRRDLQRFQMTLNAFDAAWQRRDGVGVRAALQSFVQQGRMEVAEQQRETQQAAREAMRSGREARRDGTFRDAMNAADDRRDFRNERAELIEENNLLIELERTANAELTWGPQMQILVRARQIMTRFIDLARIELARSRQELREDRRELREDRRPWNR